MDWNKATSLLVLKEKNTTVILLWVVYQALFRAAGSLKKSQTSPLVLKIFSSLIFTNCMQNNFEVIVKISHQQDNELNSSFLPTRVNLPDCILFSEVQLLTQGYLHSRSLLSQRNKMYFINQRTFSPRKADRNGFTTTLVCLKTFSWSHSPFFLTKKLNRYANTATANRSCSLP